MNNCRDYQRLIEAFEQEQLTVRDELQFITHLQECDECKEELETYYIMQYGLNDEDTSAMGESYRELLEQMEFHQLTEQKLDDRRMFVEHIKKIIQMNRWCLIFVEFCMALSAFILFAIKYL